METSTHSVGTIGIGVASPSKSSLSRQEKLFLFSSLMLITGCLLPWRTAGGDRWIWDLLPADSAPIMWAILLTSVLFTPTTVTRPALRPWFGLVTATIINVVLLLLGLLPGRSGYGAEITRLSAYALLLLSASPAIVKTGDLAMRRLNKQAAEVFTHWGTVLPGIHFSAQELYGAVEYEIHERQWPGVETIRDVHSEAGLLSHKREYLRVIRQRQVFDLCAAAFGKDFFITLREAEIRPQLTLATLLIFALAMLIALSLCVSTFGLTTGTIGFGLLLVGGVFLLLNVLRMGLTRLDGVLLRMPVIGPLYETWFRRSTTYFQHDLRVVFLKLMDDLVKARIDESTSAQGITHLSCFEHQPILDGLYKTSTRSLKAHEMKSPP